MSLQMGVQPEKMSLVLVQDGDFVVTLVSSDGDWPSTASLTIVVGGQTWPATLVGPEARWNVDKAVVNAVIATTPRKCQLLYGDTDNGTDLVWARGSVVIFRD